MLSVVVGVSDQAEAVGSKPSCQFPLMIKELNCVIALL